jgi:hypothetical protein
VLGLLMMPSGGTISVATASEQGHSLVDLTRDQASDLGSIKFVAGTCGEEPAVYVTCESGTDISDKIQAAVNTLRDLGGGVIYLPAGDFQFNTTVGTTYAQCFPGGISVIGQGVGQTILRSDGSNFFDINHWGQYNDGFRISGISFYGALEESGTYTSGGINITNVVDFRIDHCYFERILYNIGVRSGAGYPQSRGVVDHCSFVAADMTAAYGVYDSRVWDADMKLGTAEATFIEDCYMEGMGHPGAFFGGGHYVLRYNEIVDSSSIDAHGPGFDSSGRGARATEIYENTIYHNPGVYGWTAVGLRAGGGVIFGNTFQNYDHYARFSIDTPGYNATGGVYPTLDQIHDMWLWDNTLIGIANDPNDPDYEDDWDQYPNRVTVDGILLYSNEAGRLIEKDRDYFLREPNMEDDGFVYEPYIYPHPLTRELNLTGIPANQAIHLNWEVCTSLPVTSTWRINYDGTPGDEPSPITGIVSPTRTYPLTGMTNYEMYTITLSAMVDTTVIVSDTVCVMPTDIFVYLPIVQREY